MMKHNSSRDICKRLSISSEQLSKIKIKSIVGLAHKHNITVNIAYDLKKKHNIDRKDLKTIEARIIEYKELASSYGYIDRLSKKYNLSKETIIKTRQRLGLKHYKLNKIQLEVLEDELRDKRKRVDTTEDLKKKFNETKYNDNIYREIHDIILKEGYINKDKLYDYFGILDKGLCFSHFEGMGIYLYGDDIKVLRSGYTKDTDIEDKYKYKTVQVWKDFIQWKDEDKVTKRQKVNEGQGRLLRQVRR